MAEAISVRLDDEALSALNQLAATGLSRLQAIRRALAGSVARVGDERTLAAEVAALDEDQEDRVEMIAPTSRSAKPAPFRPEVEIEAVDLGRLGSLVGRVTPEERWGIDTALLTVLDLA